MSKGWFDDPQRHSLASRGIKTTTTYTKRYGGKRVKDYGFLNMLKQLNKKYPDLRIESDIPTKAPKSKNLGVEHTVIISLSPRKYMETDDFKDVKFSSHYDKLDEEWKFYDGKGNEVDIIEELESIKEEYL